MQTKTIHSWEQKMRLSHALWSNLRDLKYAEETEKTLAMYRKLFVWVSFLSVGMHLVWFWYKFCEPITAEIPDDFVRHLVLHWPRYEVIVLFPAHKETFLSVIQTMQCKECLLGKPEKKTININSNPEFGVFYIFRPASGLQQIRKLEQTKNRSHKTHMVKKGLLL